MLYDQNIKKLFVCNNRYQTNNFYYYEDDEKFVFSKRLKDLLSNFIENPTVNIGSIKSFVSNGFTIPDQTQINEIKKLLPTFRLEISSTKTTIENHWDKEISFEKKPFNDIDKKLDEYETIYRKGIKTHLELNNTNELGTLMSGGHDTSFVLIQSSQVHSKPIHTFTATFPGWAWNEESFAKNISDKFNGIFHPVPFEASDLDDIVEVIKANEEPVVSVSLPIHKIAKYASNHVDTMFGGDGGDTLWGEYYPVAEFHKYIKNLPLGLRKFIHSSSKVLRDVTDWERFWELEHVSSLFCEKNFYDNFMRKLCTYRHFPDNFQKSLFKKDFYEKEDFARSILELEFNKNNFSNMLIEAKLFNAFYTYMSFFTYKSMEFNNLNLYFPTINKDVIDFITSLPDNWINGGTTFHRLTNHKSINRRFHKRALARYLRSEEIYNRSFDIPWYKILRPRKEVLDLLLQRLISRGWYQQETLEQLFTEFQSQKVKDYELLELKHHGYRVYTLLALEIWCMEFLDAKNIKWSQGMPLEEYLKQ